MISCFRSKQQYIYICIYVLSLGSSSNEGPVPVKMMPANKENQRRTTEEPNQKRNRGEQEENQKRTRIESEENQRRTEEANTKRDVSKRESEMLEMSRMLKEDDEDDGFSRGYSQGWEAGEQCNLQSRWFAIRCFDFYLTLFVAQE